jgi:hypothetical protein
VRPWLSVVIPTAGTRREGLLRTLESVRQQQPGDSVEVLVVADTYQLQDPSPLDVLQSELQHCNVRYRWLEHDGGVHCFGQPQRSYGARAALGEWVAFSQDDNILAQDSLSAIWLAACAQPHARPLFFRARTYWGQTVWYEPEQLRMGNIDADCLVLPRAIAREISWGLRYEGDFDAAVAAHALAGGDVEWREEVIALGRPADVWWQRSPHRGDDTVRTA